MFVNISYSVDFDEVPKIVREFLQNDIQKELGAGIFYKLEDSIGHLEDGEENIGKAIQTIEEVREFLVKIDMRLLDCSSILRGYQQELVGPSETQQQPSSQTDVSSLQEGFSKFHEALGGGENETESG